ncbi:recombinase family protein [Saccharothrix obliqua]|uniref:recombinase family protein n=1 Tax=Saccharothrix obliqua TaxID=2861747 RepID=UPI001C5D81EB|nr:recombinase family protein [Saccharothrix obliqua]MBW4721990.1 recombinase family protein [Saccharothrix obliqua]
MPLTPVVSAGELVYGYVRVGEGVRVGLDAYRSEVRDHARRHGLLLGGVFVDVRVGQPAATRPGLRALLDVVRQLRPHAVVVPSLWHLSGDPRESRSLVERVGLSGCRVVTARDAG